MAETTRTRQKTCHSSLTGSTQSPKGKAQTSTQLTFWQTEKPLRESRKPDLTIAPVPNNLALEPERFYLYCGDWFAGIQLTRSQAYQAIELFDVSREPNEIWNAIRVVIDGGAVA